jgi:sigma-B regulation protein RsbU (phosphoserine phosphatase)
LRAKLRAEESEARARGLARTLQQTLIPPAPPDVPGLDVAAAYRPAGNGDEVGGDFYDVFEIGTGDWVVVVGDVCGKGVEAAAVTALARHTLRGAAIRLPPAQSLDALNDALLARDISRFCTVVMLRLRRLNGNWSVTISCGGHPQPFLLRARHVPTRVGVPGSLVGVLDDATFVDQHVPLQPGDALVLYTDGVTEGRRGDEFYGEERLSAAVTGSPASAAALVDALLTDVLEFQSGYARDDIAVVVVRVPTPD